MSVTKVYREQVGWPADDWEGRGFEDVLADFLDLDLCMGLDPFAVPSGHDAYFRTLLGSAARRSGVPA